MTPERMRQVDRLFHAALERAPEERAAFINEACQDDDSLRREVETLLAADEAAQSFIEAPAYIVAAPLLAPEEAPTLVGKSLGHYQIISFVGKGGMGEVYRARDLRLDRIVALKILPAELAADHERMQRFIREAKAASALNHPHVATIYEIGAAEGMNFIAMEYVEGQTLATKINGQPLAANEIVEIGSQIADALEEAHGKGITHRDIKPANVMLNERGQAKVLDFGLAKVAPPVTPAASSDISTMMQTAPGVVMGTVPYMSPEQALGRETDRRSDIFSLGAVLYEMATGRQAFRGANAVETIERITHAQPEAISRFNYEVPAELERIIRKCLEKERARRYQSAGELLVDLRNLKRDRDLKASRAALSPHRGRRTRKAINSLAVLPFVNASVDSETEYLSDGITESLINTLSQLPRLRVMARATVFSYKGRDVDLKTAGRELNVRAVLTGRVTQLGDRLIVGAELVDVVDGSQLWGAQYNRPLSDIFSLQEEVTEEITERLRLKLTGGNKNRLTKRYTENVEAYQLYAKGRYFWNKLTEDGARKGIGYFQQAIERDQNYALAYAGIADCHCFLHDIPQAKAAARRALGIDDALPEAHVSLAMISLWGEWDLATTRRAVKRAIRLNPNSSEAHCVYSYCLVMQGEFDEAIAEMKRALELDPLQIKLNAALGYHLYLARKYDDAVEQFRKTLDMDPSYLFGYANLAMAYEQKGMYTEAITSYQHFFSLLGDNQFADALGEAYAAEGIKGVQSRTLELLMERPKQFHLSPYIRAQCYARAGEKDQAFTWLERAYEIRSGDLVHLKVDPVLDSLRSDPRFADLMRRIGLPP